MSNRMTLRGLLAATLAFVVLFLTACSTTQSTESRQAQRPRIQPPQQPPNSVRLIIYRPQTLVGMWGRPVVVINGRLMLNVLNESMLDPGSVFVVDAPAERTKIEWMQSKQAQPSSDPLIFEGLRASPRYLRWTMKATSGHLEEVEEGLAFGQLGPLLYTGYRNVAATPQE